MVCLRARYHFYSLPAPLGCSLGKKKQREYMETLQREQRRLPAFARVFMKDKAESRKNGFKVEKESLTSSK